MSAEEPEPNPLVGLYRRYLGEPDRTVDVYLGFALFFGGLAMAAVGFVLFLWSAGLPADAALYWPLREIAFVLAFLGLPAFLLSVVVLLPVDRRVRYAGGLGVGICLLAAGLFVAVYPEQWNVQAGPDYSVQGIAVYAVGITTLAGATGAGLVGRYLERTTAGVDTEARAATDADGDGRTDAAESSPTVTDEQVAADIEAALEESDLSWGGVERDSGKTLQLDTERVESEIDEVNVTEESATVARSEGVDEAVAGLQRFQGGTRQQARGEGTEDQVQALAEFRDRQDREDREQDASSGVLGRLRDRWFK